ncbi:hypothetical protein BDZ91DRAFT_712957 [Kalaharituber pfeilii]|nr:hypothetical protein BDZ91DRAFT_712957 [Kalaharituber pfeilii]
MMPATVLDSPVFKRMRIYQEADLFLPARQYLSADLAYPRPWLVAHIQEARRAELTREIGFQSQNV